MPALVVVVPGLHPAVARPVARLWETLPVFVVQEFCGKRL